MIYYANEQSPYIQHYGVLGMKWGRRRYHNKDGSLTKAGIRRHTKEVNKINNAARKSGRVVESASPNVIGIRQKNGDILFVDRNEFNKNGVDVAERKTLNMIKEARANTIKKGKAKVSKILESEEKTLIKNMIKTYDPSDPDKREALALLRQLEKDVVY